MLTTPNRADLEPHERSSQPVRWPALPAMPVVLLGAMDLEYTVERYCHLGPLVVQVERIRSGGWRWSVGCYGRRWTARVKVAWFGDER